MKSTVVVGYDQTPSGEHALLEAAREASWRSGALIVVTAYQWWPGALSVPVTQSPTEIAHSVREAATAVAEHGADVARGSIPGCLSLRPCGRARRPTSSPTPRGERSCWSSATEGAADSPACYSARCPCGRWPPGIPTMVVRGSGPRPHGLVVAAVDVMEPDGKPLEYAFAEASRRGARLEVLHVWDLPWFLEASDLDLESTAKQATIDRERKLEQAMLPPPDRASGRPRGPETRRRNHRRGARRGIAARGPGRRGSPSPPRRPARHAGGPDRARAAASRRLPGGRRSSPLTPGRCAREGDARGSVRAHRSAARHRRRAPSDGTADAWLRDLDRIGDPDGP